MSYRWRQDRVSRFTEPADHERRYRTGATILFKEKSQSNTIQLLSKSAALSDRAMPNVIATGWIHQHLNAAFRLPHISSNNSRIERQRSSSSKSLVLNPQVRDLVTNRYCPLLISHRDLYHLSMLFDGSSCDEQKIATPTQCEQSELTFGKPVLSHEPGHAVDTIPYLTERGQTSFAVAH